MLRFIDLCCGFGSMTKAFEKTGAYKCVLAADIDENMRNHFNFLYNRYKPMWMTPLEALGDITSEDVLKLIKNTDYDILLCGMPYLSEIILFQVLEIIEKDLPKAFVLELSMEPIMISFTKIISNFCNKHGYYFIGYEDGIENITLNLEHFGIPEHMERMFCVCINKEAMRCEQDPIYHQLNKEHDYHCFKKYDPEKYPEQINGAQWAFHEFMFLKGTPKEHKKEIIRNATPIPMACSVALDLMGWL